MCKYSIDWSETVIYRMVCKDPAITETYIGSTTNLRSRRQSHKNACNGPSNAAHSAPKYVFIRANGGFENWEVVLVEAYAATDSEDARRRERFWVEHYKAELNTIRPYVSKEEAFAEAVAYKVDYRPQYYAENRKSIIEYSGRYRAANRLTINEKKCAHRAVNRESINEKKRDYYADSREKIAVKTAVYRAKNRDDINEKSRAYKNANRDELNTKARARYHEKKAAAAIASK